MATVDLDDRFDVELDLESVKAWAVHGAPKPCAGYVWAVAVVFWAVVIALVAWGVANGPA